MLEFYYIERGLIFCMGITVSSREIEDSAYAKF